MPNELQPAAPCTLHEANTNIHVQIIIITQHLIMVYGALINVLGLMKGNQASNQEFEIQLEHDFP